MRFGFNSEYLLKDGKPWFPIMGEMHYSRYPKAYWKESLYKMKAGGVDVVSSYMIWIHHEEEEGVYDFSGNKDLRSFVEDCKACGLWVILRVGPWSHAEVRNGGFPDWLLHKDFEVRSNDEAYFETVKKYYAKIYEQVEGLLLKDGGPVIGLQIENEYGHCGGLQGEAGESHMRRLTEMAKEVGFEVPLYTATGWGGAVTGGLLPVMGGYCEAPWDQRLTEIEPSGNYIFTHERNDHNIGSDFGFGTGITFDMTKFPYLTAELGGGLQVTHHRRPVAEASDIGAMSMVKLGSGVNLLGYYMYHGGTNPKGKFSTLQESKATGSINDLQELGYDFRAPIREYGQVSDTFKEIKLLTMFIKDFGEALCKMPAEIPQDNPLYPNDLEHLRTSIRRDGNKGYLFVNNYQRRYPMAEHKNVRLQVELPDETLTYPERDIKDQDYFFYPFNMPVGAATLKIATATPLCQVDDAYVFYGDEEPYFEIEGKLGRTKLLMLSREEAKNAWKVQDHLIISEAAVIETDRGIELIGEKPMSFKAYPELTEIPAGFMRLSEAGDFVVYKQIGKKESVSVEVSLIEDLGSKKRYTLEMSEFPEGINDCFLDVIYAGDSAKLYCEGELVGDHFYTGKPWEIGLKRFNFPQKLEVEIMPLEEGAPIFLETWPEMKEGVACELTEVTARLEYCVIIK